MEVGKRINHGHLCQSDCWHKVTVGETSALEDKTAVVLVDHRSETGELKS